MGVSLSLSLSRMICTIRMICVAVGEVGVDWRLAKVRRPRLRRAEGSARENEGDGSTHTNSPAVKYKQ